MKKGLSIGSCCRACGQDNYTLVGTANQIVGGREVVRNEFRCDNCGVMHVQNGEEKRVLAGILRPQVTGVGLLPSQLTVTGR